MTLSREHWTTILDAIRHGAVRRFDFDCVDFNALDTDELLVAFSCRGLQLLEVDRSVVPSGFVTEDLLRSSAAKGVLELRFTRNPSNALPGISEVAVLDFCFSADAASEGSRLTLCS